MHLCVSPVAPERPCIDDGGVGRRARTLRVRTTPRALPSPRSAALDAGVTSAQEHPGRAKLVAPVWRFVLQPDIGAENEVVHTRRADLAAEVRDRVTGYDGVGGSARGHRAR